MWTRCVLAGVVAAAAFSDAILFRYAPPDETSFVQTLKTTRVKTSPSGSQTDVIETATSVKIRKAEAGYTVVATPLSAEATRDGKPAKNPLLQALQKIEITYEVADGGKLLAIRGFEHVEGTLAAALPPAALKDLGSAISRETLIEKEKAEWEGRIAGFAGLAAKIGDAIDGTDEFSLPSGQTITYRVRTTFEERVKQGVHDCVRVRFGYSVDAGEVQRLVTRGAKEGAAIQPRLTGLTVSGGGERVIDPATLLIYSESLKRTITMQLESEGGGHSVESVEETREYRFAYER